MQQASVITDKLQDLVGFLTKAGGGSIRSARSALWQSGLTCWWSPGCNQVLCWPSHGQWLPPQRGPSPKEQLALQLDQTSQRIEDVAAVCSSFGEPHLCALHQLFAMQVCCITMLVLGHLLVRRAVKSTSYIEICGAGLFQMHTYNKVSFSMAEFEPFVLLVCSVFLGRVWLAPNQTSEPDGLILCTTVWKPTHSNC